MNRRWQANKIGLINFWYYDEQEFPFVKGRMLLRGSNGSGKSVTMQSVVPLLLDGNMSPERLDPFGSRDRKMSSYLLEENDGREERTGYLYLEFRRKDSETYLTIGMGIRARRGKPLDKWYFSLTDGRRIGKDFFLYKEMGEKVTLSKKELENRILQGGKVFDRQADYMEYVNKQIFGFETVDEYKEMVDLLIQLRTPKLSKDFKPSVINDILSDSLQPLSDEDLRPMSEAIENMDTMSMNLKSRKEAKAAAEKINAVFSKYNKIILCDKDFHDRCNLSFELDRTFGIVFIGNPCCEQFFGLCRTAIALDGSIHQFHQTLAHFFNGQRHTQTELTEIFEQRIGPSDTLTFIVRCVRSRRYRTRIDRRTARSVRYHFPVTEKLRNQFYIGSFTATRTCARELEQRSSKLRIFHVRFNIYQVLFALHILGTIIPTGSLAQLAFQIGHRQSLTVLIARTNII